jgi:outer membrane lipoprotein-sorting protein
MRQETTAQGMDLVMLMDSQTKTALMVIPAQNSAMKIDFSQAAAQAPAPGDQSGALPADAKYVGSETVDGKPASVYESTTGDTTTKYWMWTERGLPLKIETTTPRGTTVVEYTNYQFGTQPDNLFELPPGTQVIEAPPGFPGLPGGSPVPK